MDLELGSIGLGFLAGVLSLLSPCVLPILPIVLGAEAMTGWFGRVLMMLGVLVSFVAVGLFVSSIGFLLGIDRAIFRLVSAVLLGALGLILLSDALHARFAMTTAWLGDIGTRLAADLRPDTSGGAFLLGVALGAAWTPCVGPTLGAATVLASQGQNLASAAAVMFAYGAGAVVPLIVVGSVSHEVLRHWRDPLRRAGRVGEFVLGLATVLLAALILTDLDRKIEAVLTKMSPDWLTSLVVRY